MGVVDTFGKGPHGRFLAGKYATEAATSPCCCTDWPWLPCLPWQPGYIHYFWPSYLQFLKQSPQNLISTSKSGNHFHSKWSWEKKILRKNRNCNCICSVLLKTHTNVIVVSAWLRTQICVKWVSQIHRKIGPVHSSNSTSDPLFRTLKRQIMIGKFYIAQYGQTYKVSND